MKALALLATVVHCSLFNNNVNTISNAPYTAPGGPSSAPSVPPGPSGFAPSIPTGNVRQYIVTVRQASSGDLRTLSSNMIWEDPTDCTYQDSYISVTTIPTLPSVTLFLQTTGSQHQIPVQNNTVYCTPHTVYQLIIVPTDKKYPTKSTTVEAVTGKWRGYYLTDLNGDNMQFATADAPSYKFNLFDCKIQSTLGGQELPTVTYGLPYATKINIGLNQTAITTYPTWGATFKITCTPVTLRGNVTKSITITTTPPVRVSGEVTPNPPVMTYDGCWSLQHSGPSVTADDNSINTYSTLMLKGDWRGGKVRKCVVSPFPDWIIPESGAVPGYQIGNDTGKHLKAHFNISLECDGFCNNHAPCPILLTYTHVYPPLPVGINANIYGASNVLPSAYVVTHRTNRDEMLLVPTIQLKTGGTSICKVPQLTTVSVDGKVDTTYKVTYSTFSIPINGAPYCGDVTGTEQGWGASKGFYVTNWFDIEDPSGRAVTRKWSDNCLMIANANIQVQMYHLYIYVNTKSNIWTCGTEDETRSMIIRSTTSNFSLVSTEHPKYTIPIIGNATQRHPWDSDYVFSHNLQLFTAMAHSCKCGQPATLKIGGSFGWVDYGTLAPTFGHTPIWSDTVFKFPGFVNWFGWNNTHSPTITFNETTNHTYVYQGGLPENLQLNGTFICDTGSKINATTRYACQGEKNTYAINTTIECTIHSNTTLLCPSGDLLSHIRAALVPSAAVESGNMYSCELAWDSLQYQTAPHANLVVGLFFSSYSSNLKVIPRTSPPPPPESWWKKYQYIVIVAGSVLGGLIVIVIVCVVIRQQRRKLSYAPIPDKL